MKNPFSMKISGDSYALSQKRYEAFFHGDVHDRPPVCFTFGAGKQAGERPESKNYASHKERWLDYENRAAWTNYHIDSTEYYADALPAVFPNLGPEIFSAICGCPYYFMPETTWTEPCILDWERDAGKAVVSRGNEYFIAVDNFIRELLKYSKDKFCVGFTDFHAGGDHLAALRDPEALCLDLYDNPEHVRRKTAESYIEYYKMYEYFYNLTTLEGEPTSSWLPLVVHGRFNVVQNDFSCMISTKMFEEFFLEGLIEECERLDRSIFHLDGPDCIKHLDMLLEIKKLNAVQWVCGAGNEGFMRWLHVYKKIQAARKGIHLDIDISELDDVIANLKPDGLWFSHIAGVPGKAEADKVIERIANWK